MGTKLRLFVGAVAGAALLAGCLTPADISAQNDLRAGLAAENQMRTTTGQYTDSVTALKKLAPSLDWGGKLMVVVGDAVNVGDRGIVCLTEVSTFGNDVVDRAGRLGGRRRRLLRQDRVSRGPDSGQRQRNGHQLDAVISPRCPRI